MYTMPLGHFEMKYLFQRNLARPYHLKLAKALLTLYINAGAIILNLNRKESSLYLYFCTYKYNRRSF